MGLTSANAPVSWHGPPLPRFCRVFRHWKMGLEMPKPRCTPLACKEAEEFSIAKAPFDRYIGKEKFELEAKDSWESNHKTCRFGCPRQAKTTKRNCQVSDVLTTPFELKAIRTGLVRARLKFVGCRADCLGKSSGRTVIVRGTLTACCSLSSKRVCR